jgi:L-arabinonolactonase
MVFGTMNMERSTDNSHIFILDSKDSEPRILVPNVTITNGPTWSLDGKTFYYVDSANPPVYACDYDLENGTLSNKRVFCESNELTYRAFDGATIDTQGFLWWAIFGGSKIVRINPVDGKIERYIDLSVFDIQNPTSCAFGGDDYRTMIVTSACWIPPHTADLRGVGNHGGVCLITFDESEGIQGRQADFWNGD